MHASTLLEREIEKPRRLLGGFPGSELPGERFFILAGKEKPCRTLPVTQSWWVGRSQRRILKRIETIDKELARMDALTPNDLQNTVIQGIVLILLMVFQLNVLMVLMMISSSLASLFEPIFETTNQFPYPLHLVFGMLFIAITLSLRKVLDELTLNTKIYRQQLLKEKANLESRLTLLTAIRIRIFLSVRPRFCAASA
jgi:hypothetical protein